MSDTDEFIKPNHYVIKDANITQLSQPGSVLRTLQWQQQWTSLLETPVCLHIPRIQISTKRDANFSVSSSIPSFNTTQMLTMSWFYHDGHEMHMGHNLDGKNMINVANINSNRT